MREDAVVVICSRIESSRLPGKAFLEIEGIPAIEHMILRLKDTELPILIAVPEGQAKDHYVRFIQAHPEQVRLFEGDLESPLHRMAQCVEALDPRPSWILRATHDDIILDSRTALDLLELCEREDSGYGISPGIVEGAGVEVIRTENLLAAAANRTETTEFIWYFVKGEGLPSTKVT